MFLFLISNVMLINDKFIKQIKHTHHKSLLYIYINHLLLCIYFKYKFKCKLYI